MSLAAAQSRTQPRPQHAPRVLAIIPAMNEAENLGALLDELEHVHPLAHTLVVDDGSSDETADIAKARGCRVVRHPFNLGYGAALLTGYHYALRHGFPNVVQLDADGQHPPSLLPMLLEPVLRGGVDVVVGSRYLASDSKGSTFVRRLGARPLAWLATLWTGQRITDPTSGFQALSPAAVATLCSDGFPEDYPDVDVLITLHRAGLRLIELPVNMRDRVAGTSMHGGMRAFYYFYRLLVTLMLLPWRRTSPWRAERKSPAPGSSGEHRS
ncbi:MAG: glycosyltransferase family 2 protein [Planctomycetes bacterium]|nr:glycosyltransferase family 2 protein [Planctomycetota bacterium]MCB9892645.1 glycosyltransferase family 2 protein [Planctomycetota bacterium]MCB9919362.1 glycosyltransferase family 2 protein [Planctomycetota bacterium]